MKLHTKTPTLHQGHTTDLEDKLWNVSECFAP